jgi:hypothetical protein
MGEMVGPLLPTSPQNQPAGAGVGAVLPVPLQKEPRGARSLSMEPMGE